MFCLFSTRYLVYIYEYDIKSSGSNTRATRPLGYSIQLDPMWYTVMAEIILGGGNTDSIYPLGRFYLWVETRINTVMVLV